MPSTILSDNGVTSGTSGIKTTGSNDGQLALQTTTAGGATATGLTINNTQQVAFTAGSAASPAITPTGDDNTGIFFPAADTIAFAEGGAEAMRIDSSGRVGVGTTSPAAKLDVRNSTTNPTNLTANNIGIVHNSNNNAGNQVNVGGFVVGRDKATTIANGDVLGGLSWQGTYSGELRDGYASIVAVASSDSAASIVFNTSSSALTTAERMRIDSSGNVGIGTSSPSSVLHVSASTASARLASTGANGSYLRFYSNNQTTVPFEVGQGLLSGTDNIGYVWNIANAALSFGTNSAERARISAAGGFSVGTTADPGAGAIYATGNITAYYSDSRLKDVKGNITGALDKVASLNGVYYTNNDVAAQHGYTAQELQVGLLAQQVEAVLPEVVKAAPFDLDENGNSKSGENYKTVQYERIIPLLVEAIKELRAEVKALKGE